MYASMCMRMVLSQAAANAFIASGTFSDIEAEPAEHRARCSDTVNLPQIPIQCPCPEAIIVSRSSQERALLQFPSEQRPTGGAINAMSMFETERRGS